MDLFFTLALHQELANAAALVERAKRELTESIDAGAANAGRIEASPGLEMLCRRLESSVQLIRAHVERWALWQQLEREKASQLVDTDTGMDS